MNRDADDAAALPLAVTMGDPAGIGLDITLSAAAADLALPRFVLLADPETVAARCRTLGLSIAIRTVASPAHATACGRGAIDVMAMPIAATVVAGKPDTRNAAAIIGCIERAVDLVMHGEASAVVTNPIAKFVLTAAGFPHPGHTEFLAELAGRYRPERIWHPVMMLASDDIRVVPLTIHIPIAKVPAALSRDHLMATVRIIAQDLQRILGGRTPRIAVAGLNPHAGENGTIGREEIEMIAPAIAALQAEGLHVTGPHSADTMFHAEARGRYDVAVAMYHDQALIPIKTLAFDTGVNVTLGLPFVRTSPDHGTAFDIAGSGRARATSVVAAMHMAADMARAMAAHA